MDRTPPAWAVRTKADRKALAEGYYWDQAAGDRVIRFAELYLAPKFTTGEFQLFEWQRRFILSLYCWRRPDGGRRFQTAILHVPKKNGKTLLVSVIAAYELFAAAVASPLVVSASTTRENAKQVFEQLAAAIRKDAKLRRASKVVDYKKQVLAPKRDGEYRALSADAPNAEGLNCSAVIVDEAHAHRSDKLYRTLAYAMIGRVDGLMVVISTAGDDLTHWYYSLIERGRRLLAGEDLDPSTYAEIYEADPEKDDVEDPAVWARVNPSLDCFPGFTRERFALDLAKAKSNTGDWLSFQRYRLNIFQRPEDGGWVDLVRWDQCVGAVSEQELAESPCWLGFDGSQTTDPTSLSAVWLLTGKRFFVRSWAWVASLGVQNREKSNRPKYAQFIAQGSMFQTEGDMIDWSKVREKVRELKGKYQIKAMVMDPNGANVFSKEIEGEGIEVFRQPQSFRYFNDPTKSFEEAVIGGKVLHDGAAWLRWCVHSVRLDTDNYGNVRPAKRKSADHIDGAIATLMAFSMANLASADVKPKTSVYDTQGIMVF